MNFICRIAERWKILPLSPAATPAVCAAPSVRITPGTSGFPGKCPRKNGSEAPNRFVQTADRPGSIETTESIKTNGSRCGSPHRIGSSGSI
jgi:hypothetical protein